MLAGTPPTVSEARTSVSLKHVDGCEYRWLTVFVPTISAATSLKHDKITDDVKVADLIFFAAPLLRPH